MAKHRTTAESVLARRISAEVRARMGALHLNQTEVGEAIGREQNYVSLRLNDRAPFTLDDVAHLLILFGVSIDDFMTAALGRDGGDDGDAVVLPRAE